MSIDECRIKEFFLFYLLKIAERSDIHNSSIVNHHSSFHEVSYKDVSSRFNLIIIVLVVVLVLVLEIRILSSTKDEDEYDDDKVRTL